MWQTLIMNGIYNLSLVVGRSLVVNVWNSFDITIRGGGGISK